MLDAEVGVRMLMSEHIRQRISASGVHAVFAHPGNPSPADRGEVTITLPRSALMPYFTVNVEGDRVKPVHDAILAALVGTDVTAHFASAASP